MSHKIEFTFTDGTQKTFTHEGRAGGSYTKRLTFEGEFAVVTDEYGRRFAYPAARIKDVYEEPLRYY